MLSSKQSKPVPKQEDGLDPVVLPQLHLDNQLCFSLYSLSRLITQSYGPLLKPLGLTYPQYLVMLVLWQSWEEGQESLAISQLTTALKLDTGTVTPLLKRMEAKDLLARSRSTLDERIVLVSLTAEGKEMRGLASEIPQALACQSGVDEQQVVELRQQLQAFSKLLAKT